MQLEKIFGSKTKIKVLRKLTENIDWQFTIAELARDLKVDKSLISRIIVDLEKLNVVKTLKKGSVKLVNINKENEFIQRVVIKPFKEAKTTLEEICKDFIKKLKPSNEILSVLLYGSAAKGTMTPASDIDIMIIVKRKLNKLEQKLNKISQEFSHRDVIIFHDVITKVELDKLIKQKDPMIIDTIKNHKVLWGVEVP